MLNYFVILNTDFIKGNLVLIHFVLLEISVIAPALWLLEHYFSSWLKCMAAHVNNLQGPSVILVPSRHFQVRPLPRSLGLSCSWRLPVSQARWSPLHTLPSADTTLKVRTSQVTFRSQVSRVSAVSGRAGTVNQLWPIEMRRKDVFWLLSS